MRAALLAILLLAAGCYEGGGTGGDSGGGCCRCCDEGKPCGDACIARDRNCNQSGGCACYCFTVTSGQTIAITQDGRVCDGP